MALNIEGYVTPEQDFRGLSMAANQMREDKMRQEQRQLKGAAQRASMANMLASSLDQKDFLTGTQYDPQIVTKLGEIMDKGMQLANMEGMEQGMLTMSLAPEINKLAQYSQKVKSVNSRIAEQLKLLPNDLGYNKLALEQEARRAAFLGDDGKLRDMSEVDPEADYITLATQRNPLAVTSSVIFDKIAKESPKFTEVKSVSRTNAKGGREVRKSKVTAPEFMIVDDEGELVPKFELAKDGDQLVTATFQTPAGAKKAPVRMVTDEVFAKIMSSYPAAADYIRGQVMQAMGGNGDLNSPQAKNLAKAFTYDALKASRAGSIEDVEEIKAAPAPRITVNTGGSKSGKEVTVLDFYSDYDAAAQAAADKGLLGTAVSNFPPEAQSLLLEVARNLTGNKEITQADIMIRKENGKLYIMDNSKMTNFTKQPPSDAYIAPLTKTGVNVKANTQLGQAAKIEAAKDGKTPTFKGVPKGGF